MTRPRPLPRPAPGQALAGPVPSPRSAPPEPTSSPAPLRGPQPAAGPPADPPAPAGADVEVWELVRRAQAGDAEGFGQLYDRYVDVVFRFLVHRVGDRATAEDFTSETFVRALRRIDSLTFQGRDVGAWLITIARNIVLDHVKSSRYRLEVSTADMRDADRATDGPEDAVLQGLTNEVLLAGVQRLSGDQRECIVLRFLQGLSVAETAAAMGKKEGAVKALQHRAVRRLATLLPEGLQ
ncbi:sigma-70 family RNA polymerase sigma factor [Modestobacter sp. NPDC049651]|uniref:sigma-70 family RNA polymerase sigma factor n=1 Tax=unclassified Modestobacter TaxID=2643866 RepID=UPI0033E83008